jgi:uncharacterized protein YdcH (DUF465 family)
LTSKNKLDQDFNDFNQDIERASEKELTRLHKEINDLKDKANKISEVIALSPIERKDLTEKKVNS